jgi:hypothetical protein
MNEPKTDRECMISMEQSLRTIRRIATWWLVLSIVAVVLGVVYAGVHGY